jgi:hypothetical protein
MPRATVVDMTRRPHPPRSASVVIAALVATALMTATLTGCGPAAPTPTPTPTGFASEEEAFAAAEATYRAYVDALNQVDLSDPTTFEEVYRWTTGDANAAVRESFSQMHADNWSVSGDSIVTLVEPIAVRDGSDEVALAVCLDVSDVQVTDPIGESMVSPSRGQVQTMTVTVERSEALPTEFTVARIEGREGEPACGP